MITLQTKDGMTHSFPDGTPQPVIQKAIQKYELNRPLAPQLSERQAMQFAPTIGSMIGAGAGTEGGWAGRIAGSAIGSMGGEATRQLYEATQGNPETSVTGALGKIGRAGLTGAGTEAGGQILGEMVGGAGKELMKNALRAPKALDKYGDLAEQAIQDRARIGTVPFGSKVKGSVQAEAPLAAVEQDRNIMLAENAARGKTIPLHPFVQKALSYAKRISRAKPEQAAAINDEILKLKLGYGPDLHPEDARDLQRIAEESSTKSALEGERHASDIKKFWKYVRNSGRATNAANLAPSYAQSLGRTADFGELEQLIARRTGLKKAIESSEAGSIRGRTIASGVAGGTAAAIGGGTPMQRLKRASSAFAIGYALSNPSIASRVALGLTDPLVQAGLRQAPRFATAMMTAPDSLSQRRP